MKIKVIVFCLSFACILLFSGQTAAGPAPAPDVNGVGSSVPLAFIANAGQTDAKALYYARTQGSTLWLTREGLVLDRVEIDQKGRTNRSVSRLIFKDTCQDFQVMASDPSDYKVSYFLGSDESEWKTGIPTSRAVVYKNLYDGIDLKVYGTDRRIEYDWILAPGARPERIRFSCTGAKKARLDDEGNLSVETPGAQILHRRPRAFQVIGGRRVDVEAAFRERTDGSCGFAVGAYDSRYELAIDPLILAYGTYLGGHKVDSASRLAVDRTGAIYVAGYTFSGDFPPESGSRPRQDIFVTKLSSDGQSLVYTAFFPAGGDLSINARLFVDFKGFVYLAGSTSSGGFPVKNAFQSKFGGGKDGFVLKLSRDGQSLVFSSYIGGGRDDVCSGLFADASGAAYIGGYTFSRDFPTKRAYQPAFGGALEAFVAKVAPAGSSLVYSTFLGGTKNDQASALTVDADGAAILVGITGSRDFPRKSAFQKSYGGGYFDGFVTKLSPAGNGLVSSTFLGGEKDDVILGVAADGSGAIYVAGYTNGMFPVKNAFQKTRKGGTDAFVTKFEPKGKAIVYSSYLGGSANDYGYEIAVDGDGAAYIVGYMESLDFPVKIPYQASLRGGQDAFLTIVDPSGLKLGYSTYLGGRYRETCFGIALGADGGIYLGGITNSPDFPVLGAYQDALAGDFDAFVLKFTLRDDARSR